MRKQRERELVEMKKEKGAKRDKYRGINIEYKEKEIYIFEKIENIQK